MLFSNIERIFYIYTAQILLSFIIAALFFFYYRSYKRPFLKWWSISWLSYCIFYIFSFAFTSSQFKPISLGLIFFSYLQLLFLIIGVVEFSRQKPERRALLVGILLISVGSLLSYFLFKNNPEAFNQRYVIRVGVKSFIIGAGFFWVAMKVLYSSAFSRSFSKYFLTVAFIFYALQQFWHSTIVILNATGTSVPFPLGSFGIVDLFSMSLIGIGMIMWLLENEHSRLNQANKELDSFLYSTSHDLRAPIASVLGLTNLGKLEANDATAIEYFNKIESRVKKLDVIVGDILNYAKSTKIEIAKDQIDFGQMVKEIFQQLQFGVENHRIKLHVANNSSSLFYSDSTQISIILNNLISNAIKYHDGEKAENFIKAELQRKDKLVHLSIEDNGIGIEKENLGKIFDMFYRATNMNEGSGLGLFIAYEAAKKLKAEIQVTSVKGKGSKFTLALNENWI